MNFRANGRTGQERTRVKMKVRMAADKDIERIHELLAQVALIHHNGRPDLFKYGQSKYTDEKRFYTTNSVPSLRLWMKTTVLWATRSAFFSSI